MERTNRPSWDLAPRPDAGEAAGLLSPETHLINVLRFAAPDEGDLQGARPSSPQDWSLLIDRVREAAGRAREVETQAREQEQRVQDILERVREDIRNADTRVRAAEARAVEAQAQAAAQIRAAESRAKAAEERAKAAEERAGVAEGWLARVHETITREFEAQPAARKTA